MSISLGYLGEFFIVRIEKNENFFIFQEKLKLEVPWKNIFNQPTKVTVSGLYLLVVPRTGESMIQLSFQSFMQFFFVHLEIEYDAQRDEKEQHEIKMRNIQRIEQTRRLKEKQGEKMKISFDFLSQIFIDLDNESEKTDNSLVERIRLRVIENLELTIENIHIVYEDRTTKPSHPFSFGVTLNSFTLHVKFQSFSNEFYLIRSLI